MAAITVNGNTINPEAQTNISVDAKKSNFIYILCLHDLSIAEKQQLVELKVQIEEYIAELTYLCRYEPSDLEPIRALDFVKAANVYHAQLKSTVSLKDMVHREADRDHYEVDVILHDSPDMTSEDLAEHVARAAGVSRDQLEIAPTKVRLIVNQDKLGAIAALDNVNRIEEVQEKVCYNDQARMILHVDGSSTLVTKYQGQGQMVCVADSGFDRGVVADTETVKVHPAFVDRVEQLLPMWAGYDASDPVGHGTHVCGSICGTGIYKNAETGNVVTLAGTAPAAKLLVQAMSVFSTDKNDWILKVPVDLSQLFSKAYDLGARIHNNSWGAIWTPEIGQKGYEAEATAIDRFVTKHLDFVILVSAGNDADKKNHGESQIGDNSSAKNCITIGATGTTRSNDGWRFLDKPDTEPLSRVTDTAKFSSRGPTKATIDSANRVQLGRIKPDVVAPGVAVLSAASQKLKLDSHTRHECGRSNDDNWIYMSGTSMSTPLVAGCVALLREALQQHGAKHAPSSALIKALLINGAQNYSGPPSVIYDYEQGFGQVNIATSITMVEQSTFIDGGNPFESTVHDVPTLFDGQTWESSPIPLAPHGTDATKLSVTLAYSDHKGALLQNNLNLIVRAGGHERHGNMLPADPGFDRTNNVEKVIWTDVPGTEFTIVVQANGFTKPGATQSFAVAWHV